MIPHTLAEKIKNLLVELRRSTPDIDDIVLVDMNGLPMISILYELNDDSPISAMAVSILSTAQRTLEEIKLGKVNNVIIQGEKGYVIFVGAGKEAILTVLTTRIAKLDNILADANTVAQNIAMVLKERA